MQNIHLNRIAFFAFVFLFSCLVFSPLITYGIGQMSQPIVFENALKGGEYTQLLILLNTETVPVKFGLSADGDIAGWTTFYKPDNLNTPITEISMEPKANMQVMAKFSVPGNAENRTYKGNVNIFSKPDAANPESSASINVSLSVPRPVTISVTGIEQKTVSCQIIPKNLTINQGDPLTVTLWCKNTGNVSVKPLTRIIVTKDGAPVDEKAFVFPEDKKRIIPNAMVNWDVSWPTIGQQSGQYSFKAQIMVDDGVVVENEFGLTINNKINALFPASLASFMKGRIAIGSLIVVLLLLAGAFAIYFMKKRAKKSSQTTL